jgi:8-oxo-dGTP pyrophosphatase MutT (NUDIX family)
MLKRVVAEVSARTPVNDREQASVDRFLAQVQLLRDPFSEHADPIHVTASGIIIGPRGIVLHRHRILGTWVAPGGHIDEGEAPWDAARREAAEETGLAVEHFGGVPTLVHVDVHEGPNGHTHLDLRYLLDGGDADPAPPAEESQEVAWFAWDEAAAITEPCMRGIVGFLTRSADGDQFARIVRSS